MSTEPTDVATFAPPIPLLMADRPGVRKFVAPPALFAKIEAAVAACDHDAVAKLLGLDAPAVAAKDATYSPARIDEMRREANEIEDPDERARRLETIGLIDEFSARLGKDSPLTEENEMQSTIDINEDFSTNVANLMKSDPAISLESATSAVYSALRVTLASAPSSSDTRLLASASVDQSALVTQFMAEGDDLESATGKAFVAARATAPATLKSSEQIGPTSIVTRRPGQGTAEQRAARAKRAGERTHQMAIDEGLKRGLGLEAAILEAEDLVAAAQDGADSWTDPVRVPSEMLVEGGKPIVQKWTTRTAHGQTVSFLEATIVDEADKRWLEAAFANLPSNRVKMGRGGVR